MPRILSLVLRPYAYERKYYNHPHNGRTCVLCFLTLYLSHPAGCLTTAATMARLAAFLPYLLLSIRPPLSLPVDSVLSVKVFFCLLLFGLSVPSRCRD